jgi:hypothetical protein
MGATCGQGTFYISGAHVFTLIYGKQFIDQIPINVLRKKHTEEVDLTVVPEHMYLLRFLWSPCWLSSVVLVHVDCLSLSFFIFWLPVCLSTLITSTRVPFYPFNAYKLIRFIYRLETSHQSILQDVGSPKNMIHQRLKGLYNNAKG